MKHLITLTKKRYEKNMERLLVNIIYFIETAQQLLLTH